MTVLATFTSDSGKTYSLRTGADGVIYCDCPAWRFSKARPRDCKHLQRIRGFLTNPNGLDEFRRMMVRAVAGSAEADVLR